MEKVIQLGYPYSYGGAEITADPNEVKLFKITLLALGGLFFNPSLCFAADQVVVQVGDKLLRKTALEAARSTACAASGACFLSAIQNGQNPARAAAFACGGAIFMCIDTTAKLCLAK
jgi:hypothetical protein